MATSTPVWVIHEDCWQRAAQDAPAYFPKIRTRYWRPGVYSGNITIRLAEGKELYVDAQGETREDARENTRRAIERRLYHYYCVQRLVDSFMKTILGSQGRRARRVSTNA